MSADIDDLFGGRPRPGEETGPAPEDDITIIPPELAALEPPDDESQPNGAPDTGPDQPAGLSDEEVLAGLIGMAIDIRRPEWHFADADARILATAYVPVIRKWAPWLLDMAGVEVAAIIATAVVFRKYRNIPRPEGEDKANGAAATDSA